MSSVDEKKLPSGKRPAQPDRRAVAPADLFDGAPTSHFRLPIFAFTLIELVFVMAILGILLAASIPRFAQTAERLRVERSAFELTQSLRYAHERAVAEGRDIIWLWDKDAHRAQLHTTKDDGSVQPLGERFTLSASIPQEILVTLRRDRDPVDRVRFLPDGTSQPTTIHVAHGTDAYTVTVDEATSQALLSAGTPAR